MTTTTIAPLQDIISPKFHQNNFAEEFYVKNDLGVKLDKGAHTAYAVVVWPSSPFHPRRPDMQTVAHSDRLPIGTVALPSEAHHTLGAELPATEATAYPSTRARTPRDGL